MDALFHELAHYWAELGAFLAVDPARLSEPDMVVRLSLQVVLLFGSGAFHFLRLRGK